MNRSTDQPINRLTSSRGFTLVELLVVIAIIVSLLAILLPSLQKSISHAQLAVCLSNQKQIDNASLAYLGEHFGQYAAYSSWTALIGKLGTSAAYNSNTLGPEVRPLNAYVSNAFDVARCPSDLGDTHTQWGNSITNCYEQYGNSYQSPWNYDVFRAAYVFGIPGSVPARRITDFSRADNKVVIGDFVWWLNRYWSNPRTRWHDPGPVRKIPIAFADGHAAVITVPAEYEAEGSTSGQLFPPNPGFIFW